MPFEFECTLRFRVIFLIGTAVDFVDLVAQAIQRRIVKVTVSILPLDNAAVVDHAAYASNGVAATTEAKHPDLVVFGVVSGDVFVRVSAVFAHVTPSSTVEEVF